MEQYARFRRPKTDRYRRATLRLVILSLTIWVALKLGVLSLYLAVRFAPEWSIETLFAHDLGPWFRAATVIAAVGGLAGFVAMGIEVAIAPPADKRKAVQAAARRRQHDRN